MRATHIPRLPKKKPLRGKKVGSAEKKLRLTQKKWRIVCVKGGIFLSMILATTDPIRGSLLWLRYLQVALQASPFACMELSTISHLRWRLARPHIPATRLFVLFHLTQATIPLNLTKSSSRYQKEP